jgi:hypothetical protein
VELWVTNDTLEALAETVTVQLGRFDGATIWEETLPVLLPAQQSRSVAAWDAVRLDPGAGRFLAVHSPSGRFPPNRHFFTAIKDLHRPAAAPEMTVSQISQHELRVELRGAEAGYALFVHLLVPHEATRYSDNYVDLAPHEARTIIVTNDLVPLTPEMVTLGWR